MLESGDRKEIIRFLTDVSIKLLSATNTIKEGRFWYAINKLTGLQQKLLDELGILTKNENTVNENTDNE